MPVQDEGLAARVAALEATIHARQEAATWTQGFIDGIGAECAFHSLADLPWYGDADQERRAALAALYEEAYGPAR